MSILIAFADPISEAYREKLQKFADSILAQGITENRPPTIGFPGMNQETFDKIGELQCDYYDRYGT